LAGSLPEVRWIGSASTARQPPIFHRLRQLIAEQLEDAIPVEGLIEVDESYFGGVRKGKRGRGAVGKVPVFVILKRGGKVYTVMIPNVRKVTLLPIIRQRIVPVIP